MPELPEVETIKRELQPLIINQRIKDCKILRKDIIGYPSPERFCRGLINETIQDVIRRAKYLIIVLSNGKRLIFHLRLSGRIIVMDEEKDLPLKCLESEFKKTQFSEKFEFARLIIKLENKYLIFSEPRALGRVYLIKEDEKPDVLKGFYNLSYEPLSPEYDFNYFKNKIRNRKAMIKSVLLDQSICAGVGNIYSDEALFHSGIRPTRRANTLKIEEIFKLFLAIKDVLRKGIDEFGTTVSDYKRTDGKSGNFQNFLCVYDREGKPCKKCGKEIIVKKIGNRSTRYCPECQK
ncbi:MAG: bifunctional DNA-formamidopyrimidine glycosylase/DNA-(apurinic or apyrimidinic site) lyase [candidate division WOR-3 bacterium]|nr:bifunctional DNA-formamidopyrimidine glycosylase/DNA-(apurinic or apyrimidinic site) lyase [candidate division WOR-3 bacterium]